MHLFHRTPLGDSFWRGCAETIVVQINYEVSLRIQSECGKIRTRITPNTDTFHTVPNRRFPKLGKILMIYLQKIFCKFKISILKYYNSQNLNHFQVAELLFRLRLSHGQGYLNRMFVTASFHVKHYFFRWL